MSRMNRIRIINLNYNNNAIKIDDETFELGGESTLFSLRNGGGKSVLVQILMAPFVHKRYRDTKDRTFASYFTTNKPTLILVEWALDGGMGYVLTGMMIRRNGEHQEEQGQDELEILQFVHEYKHSNPYDIEHFPFVELSTENHVTVKKLKGYHVTKQLLENLKLEKKLHFDVYDMSVSSRTRMYFDKLKEYQIYYKEWESIVKKVNLKESGLSDLFTDSKDESGLVEKWFLDAVENKLNKEENKVKEFGQILLKYIKQYNENKTNLTRKQSILIFKEEMEGILVHAKALQKSLGEKKDLENKLGNLIKELKELHGIKSDEKQLVEDLMKELEEAIRDILHEEISYHIYNLKQKIEENTNTSEEIQHAIQTSILEKENFQRKRQLQECARLKKDYEDVNQEVMRYQSDLEYLREKNKDLTPERERLGYHLRHYYEEQIREEENKQEKQNQQIQVYQRQIIHQNEELNLKFQEEKENLRKEGEVKVQIENYSAIEDVFNKKYKETLGRNILGEYEEGILNDLLLRIEKEISVITTDIGKWKQERERNEERLQTDSRDLEDLQKEVGSIQTAIEGGKKELLSFEDRINIRKTLLQHINLSDESVFQTPYILELFQKKIMELEDDLKKFEREKDQLQQEYQKLETGKVIELPKEMEEFLDTQGIHFIYGMEWLKKNKKTEYENKDIVEQNPFIPYSIVMSEKELEKLAEVLALTQKNMEDKDSQLFTSFPIPILKREDLEKSEEIIHGRIFRGSKVSFYLMFNQDLLEELGLAKLLTRKDKERSKLIGNIKIKEDEISFYRDKRDQIRYDLLSEKLYKQCKQDLDQFRKKKVDIENKILDLRTEKNQLEDRQRKLIDSLQMSNHLLVSLTEKKTDFLNVKLHYEGYLNYRVKAQQMEAILNQLQSSMKELKKNIQELENSVTAELHARNLSVTELKQLKEKVSKYLTYDICELLNSSISEIEARYDSITKEITMDQQVLEEQLERTQMKLQDKEAEYKHRIKRFLIEPEDLKQEIYDRFQDEELEKKIKQKEEEISKMHQMEGSYHTNIAVFQSNLDNKMKELEEKLQKTILKPKESIVAIDFKGRIQEKALKKEKLSISLEAVKEKLFCYEDNLSGLEEYDHFMVETIFVFVPTIKEYEKEELQKFRRSLLRDYKNSDQLIHDREQAVMKEMHGVMNYGEFQDEFFKKTLDTMYPLLNNPTAFMEQATITIASYDSLLQKLEVDLALLEEERTKVTDMLLEYVGDIHKHLGKIDKNATIRIREKSIKMLRIQLPSWEEEERIYKTRLNDFIENLTTMGIRVFESGASVEELIGSQLTTKNLFDTVVGIGNVGIKLYKVEEQREYQITWAEVAKNSGGEGFLSAFVILSSLLSYMRREDSDLFTEYEEGKVLIMDNPFAQTNAAHLLKPLMDIAKKTNTQLICLSGLGGESIYNRFDNIYVLNVIPSDLRRGVHYLRGEHTKGEEEIQVMSSSRVVIEDASQMELLF